MRRTSTTLTTLALAGLLMLATAGAAPATLLWQDEFARPSSRSAGNGWIETEHDSNDVGIVFNHYLLLRDRGPDASAKQTDISTQGYDNITVEFRWRAWSAESADRLTFAYRGTAGIWQTVFDTTLGGSEYYRTASLSLGSDAADTEALDLAFALDATWYDDAVKIDYVRVYGDEIVTGSPTSIGTPPAFATAATGLIAGAAFMRRRRKR